MSNSKSSKKKYRSVQFPEALVKEVQLLIKKYPIYRNHHEFFIDAGINKIIKFIDVMYKRSQLMIKEDGEETRRID
jgi:hypothetical protein